MNSNEAKEIFLMRLPELSEPLKSAVEFALANWHKLNREPRASDVAINFFASLPALPSNNVDETFAAKLNEMAKLLRDDPDVWLNLNDLPHEEWRDVFGYAELYQVSNYGRIKSFQRGKLMIISPTKCRKYPYVTLFKPSYRNNCVWNLEWATRKENAQHAIRLGLRRVAPDNPNPPKEIPAGIQQYILKNYKRWDRNFGTKAMIKKFKLPFKTLKRFLRENKL